MPKRIIWSEEARAQLRAIDRDTALRLLHGLARFAFSQSGDVRQLEGYDPRQFRPRLGDYRIRFRHSEGALQILSVKNRREAYR